MISRLLKDYYVHLAYRRRYPQASIGFGSRVVDCSCGERVAIGERCSLARCNLEANVHVHSANRFSDVNIGSYSYFAEGSTLSGVTFGRFCSVGPECLAGYGDHPTEWISTNPVFFSTRRQCGVTFSDCDCFDEKKPITIGNDVWIGARVFLRDGICIGNGAIVAAGAVVVKDVPDYAIVGGVPAKVIRLRFSPEEIGALLRIQWWHWREADLSKASRLFRDSNVQALTEWWEENACR